MDRICVAERQKMHVTDCWCEARGIHRGTETLGGVLCMQLL